MLLDPIGLRMRFIVKLARIDEDTHCAGRSNPIPKVRFRTWIWAS